ncbi:hypothetical protein BVC71_13380 [Marivivens niveibacter]|uniref:EF-hand domain-containing protein n=1 Tax=Marivivens niveibacter TaxID=1930667 RepID=A0A251WVW3_9RHOB|nr:EF-hand domain-containing protein [Marivivens niveibacter]OUD08486.1 hypothetical protein BVC71_13380 [Marivivens niveibacter]
MLRALILKTILILKLAVTSALAQQSARDIRLPIGLTLLDPGSAPISFNIVSEAAKSAFASMDADADKRINIDELRNWRNTVEVRSGEDQLGTLLKLGSERLMQSADHDNDKAISLPEFRALSLYDFNVHDKDGNSTLSSDETATWQPTLVIWAARPCLKFGVGEGMLLGAFCGK